MKKIALRDREGRDRRRAVRRRRAGARWRISSAWPSGTKEWTDPEDAARSRRASRTSTAYASTASSPNFVIQGGDPFTRYDDMKSRWGTGGPGFKIKYETAGKKQKHVRGSLSMAHAGPDTGGSQFFICHSAPSHLDSKHTVFGKVIAGIEVIDQIREGDKMKKVWVE